MPCIAKYPRHTNCLPSHFLPQSHRTQRATPFCQGKLLATFGDSVLSKKYPFTFIPIARRKPCVSTILEDSQIVKNYPLSSLSPPTY